MAQFISRLARGFRKPPGVVARKALREVRGELGAFFGERFAIRLREDSIFLESTAAPNEDALWSRLAMGPYPIVPVGDLPDFQRCCSTSKGEIIRRAQAAKRHEVMLFSAEPLNLGERISWQRDYVANLEWPHIHHRRIDYQDLDRPSDVKFPWELSRFQWLLPTAQAFLLTRDESFADAARGLLDDWIEQNPYGIGVNWACAMEVAVRAVTWTWLFRAFQDSISWRDAAFRSKFLRAIFLHGVYIEENLEETDLNGNHFLADAAGLVFLGHFFGHGKYARRWAANGWRILCHELSRQILPDGVDYEASVAYHRLVLELLVYPAVYRKALGLDIPREYADSLRRMAMFVAAYSRADGTSPLIGDADDGRLLPLGGENLLDHRYLVAVVGAFLNDDELLARVAGPLDTAYWILGASACRQIRSYPRRVVESSQRFPDSGFVVMRDERSHVFVDCGPVGLAGRGGHGHNDCLSFEAVLDGAHVVTDSGTLTYTRSFSERNRFRATAAHNTPVIDHREINRLSERVLWASRNDAQPTVLVWRPGSEKDYLGAEHSGYLRLRHPVAVRRRVVLDHALAAIAVEDEFSGIGEHHIVIPLHLAPGLSVSMAAEHQYALRTEGRAFRLVWHGDATWRAELKDDRVSPSYGVELPAMTLRWSTRATLPVRFRFHIVPERNASLADGWMEWLRSWPS